MKSKDRIQNRSSKTMKSSTAANSPPKITPKSNNKPNKKIEVSNSKKTKKYEITLVSEPAETSIGGKRLSIDDAISLYQNAIILISQYVRVDSTPNKAIRKLYYDLIVGQVYDVLRTSKKLKKNNKKRPKYLTESEFFKDMIEPIGARPKRRSDASTRESGHEPIIVNCHRSTLNKYLNAAYMEVELRLEHGKYAVDALIELKKDTTTEMRLDIWKNVSQDCLRLNKLITKPLIVEYKNRYFVENEINKHSTKRNLERELLFDDGDEMLLVKSDRTNATKKKSNSKFEEISQESLINLDDDDDQILGVSDSKELKKAATKDDKYQAYMEDNKVDSKRVDRNELSAENVLENIKKYSPKQRNIILKRLFPTGTASKYAHFIIRRMMTNELNKLKERLYYKYIYKNTEYDTQD